MAEEAQREPSVCGQVCAHDPPCGPGECRYDPAPDQGERDGLAERLDEEGTWAAGHAMPRIASLFMEAADEIRHLRTSTEGPTRVDEKRGSTGGASEQLEPSPKHAGSARSRAGGPAPSQGERDGLADDIATLRSVIGLLREYGPANVNNVWPICDEAADALTRLAALRTSTEGPAGDLGWAFSLMLDCLQAGKEPEDYEWDRINAIDAALARDESSTEGGAQVDWDGFDKEFGLNRHEPAQSEGAGDDLARTLHEYSAENDLGWKAGLITDIVNLARASTHPEQSGRVEAVKAAMTALRCWITVAEDREREEPDPYNERPEVIGESLAALHGLADAFGLERKTHPFDFLEPASPTPTEQGEDA